MSEARDKRNEEIRHAYMELLKKGSPVLDAIEAIYNSAQNKSWCLQRDTIRVIATYKNYGKPTPKERARC